jgi:ABC-type multidrug transport system permease subunit
MKVVITIVTTAAKIMIIIITKLRILKKERISKRRKKDGEIYTVKFDIFGAISFYLIMIVVFVYFCMSF